MKGEGGCYLRERLSIAAKREEEAKGFLRSVSEFKSLDQALRTWENYRAHHIRQLTELSRMTSRGNARKEMLSLGDSSLKSSVFWHFYRIGTQSTLIGAVHHHLDQHGLREKMKIRAELTSCRSVAAAVVEPFLPRESL